MIFEQIYVSQTLEKAFGENIRTRWNLNSYSNINSPAIFFGLYKQSDLDVLLNHKGKFLVIWGGGDMRESTLELVKPLINFKQGFTCAFPGEFSNTLKYKKIPHLRFYLEIKDYSKFIPMPLGNKIYIYRGWKGSREEYFKWNEISIPLIKHFGEDRVIYTDNKSVDELINTYYKDCFAYVKPTPRGGCTTMFELGYMGRKTFGAGIFNLPNFTKYKNLENLIQLIEKEEKNIGQTNFDLAKDLKKSFIDSSWLNLKFWLNR